ncbi:MAG: amino acid aminotransferase [Pirellulales bacterium]
MFESVKTAPPDAILGLADAFRADPHPGKINLSVGSYKDESGITPIMECVKLAEERLLRDERSKDYMSIQGSAAYGQAVQELLFGSQHEAVTSKRLAVAQTPGGTAALRVAADFLAKQFPQATVWVSDPTWPNHPGIFQAAGLAVRTYPYFDKATNGLAWDALKAALSGVSAGDVVVLHGCCHNPTGIDPTAVQWRELAELLRERRALPLLDFAYQGLAAGLEEDALALRVLAQPGTELLVASSFSKNFGLYNERVGALTAVCRDAATAEAVLSQLKSCIRVNYSNPPSHGGAIVSTVLTDPALRKQWEQELADLRGRIAKMRRLFVDTLSKHGVRQDFSFIERQRGMFSFSGLTPLQVDELRKTHGVYVVGSGRINVAGMTTSNMDALCKAVAAVL